MTLSDADYILQCAELSRKSIVSGNPPFSALLVRDGEILLRAHNTQVTTNDFSAHAEFNLIKAATKELSAQALVECTLYASSEPCPMCVGAIYWSGIRKVVYGCRSEVLTSIRGFGWPISCQSIFEKGTDQVEVVGPVQEDQIAAILQEYFSR